MKNTIQLALTFHLLALSLTSLPARAEVSLDLPFKANNLSWREYYARNKATHGGLIQKYGFDLVAKRYNSQLAQWSMISVPWQTYDKDPRNDLHVVYEQPVYAMESGTIVACWRNAPENPQAARSNEGFGNKEENFLHEKLRSGFMPGGGNILWVDHADGSRALYAHFRTGTIPAALCTKNKALFDKPFNEQSETVLEGAERVEIKRGQYLGLVGNAGNSTAPHLHIHVERDGKAETVIFNHGLASPVIGSITDPGQWAAFRGGPIPPGPNLIWPPRKLGDHFARHGFPAAQFQKWFLHLSDSGYWLTWVDLFSSAGGDYLNMVWQPARGRWRAHVGIDAEHFQKTFDEAVKDRYFPVLADVGTWNGMPRYAAIYRENEPGRFELRFGLTDEQAQAGFNHLVAQGFVPQSSSVISINGQRRHTVLYRKAAVGSFWARSSMTAVEYQQAWQMNQAAGRNVRYLDIYRHVGQAYFSAIFSALPKGEGIGKHGLDGNAFQQAFEEGYQEGFRLQLVAGYDGGTERQYAAAWFRQAAPVEQPARAAALRRPATTVDAPSAKLSTGHAQRAEQRIPERIRHKSRALGSSADEGGDIIHRKD